MENYNGKIIELLRNQVELIAEKFEDCEPSKLSALLELSKNINELLFEKKFVI